MNTIVTLNKQELTINQKVLGTLPNLNVSTGDRIGLIGKNGTGKSTLIKKMINQQLEGYYHFSAEDVGYFEQEVIDSKLDALSGGQRNMTRLKKLFLENKPLLILDEPTNHLDNENLSWLVSKVNNYQGTTIIISHDRQFLDQTAQIIWRLADQSLTVYHGNYSAYYQQYTAEQARLRKQFENQEKKKRKVKEELTRLHNWSASAHAQSTKQEFFKEFYREKARKMDKQRKSTEKRLQQQLAKDGVERPRDEKGVAFDFMSQRPKNGPAIMGEHLSKAYGDHQVIDNCQLTIMFGEHVAITGPNGAGKTTLLKMIVGQTTFEGKLWLSPSVDLGYLSQEVFDLESDWSIQQFVTHYMNEDEFYKEAFLLFIQLGFDKEQWTQKIATLSMGERLKIKLLKQMIQGKNVLIFDEPTNHLDLDSREALEEVLAQYKGTLIVVSHDNYFIDKIAKRQLDITTLNEAKEGVTLDLDQQESDKKELEMRLQLKKDQLISQLSLLSPHSKEYQLADEMFKQTLQALREIK